VALAAPAAGHAESLAKLLLESRLRYETVDQDGFAQDAVAVTLRTRLGLETKTWRGWSALVEGEAVTALEEDYNSTTNGRLAYPVVADPEATELNRAQLAWKGEGGGVTLGRQRIILGDARFVGSVGFRQNEQTFDAVRVDLRPSEKVSVSYAYVDRVQRVFGPDSAQGAWDSRSHLAQMEAKTPAGLLTLHGQLLDLPDAPAMSSATFGARLAGKRPLGEGRALTYHAAYARQTDYADAPRNFDLDYAALGAGVETPAVWASAGVERLDGDGRRGFQTPLATLHAFQGWADVFLTTPPNGIRDLHLKAGGALDVGGRKLRLAIAAHDFADADGGADYGRELDAAVVAPINKHWSAELKAARFDGAGAAWPDRTKVWLTLEFKI
jgi:hypothetical protein